MIRRVRTWLELIGKEIPKLTSSLTTNERKMLTDLLSVGDQDIQEAAERAERIAELIPWMEESEALQLADKICIHSYRGKYKKDVFQLLEKVEESRRDHVREVIKKTVKAKLQKLAER